ncbi:hypothetical protein VNO77_39073 [Canavalia gladiata]|uniref:Uncharacterized protein n=1 Tax=Canavalia gladiata TaxID=3824 RepID=A0AAN9KCH6_CANGL
MVGRIRPTLTCRSSSAPCYTMKRQLTRPICYVCCNPNSFLTWTGGLERRPRYWGDSCETPRDLGVDV